MVHISKINTLTMHLAMCAQKSVFSLVKSGKYINVFIPAQKAPSDGDLGHCLLALVEGKHVQQVKRCNIMFHPL